MFLFELPYGKSEGMFPEHICGQQKLSPHHVSYVSEYNLSHYANRADLSKLKGTRAWSAVMSPHVRDRLLLPSRFSLSCPHPLLPVGHFSRPLFPRDDGRVITPNPGRWWLYFIVRGRCYACGDCANALAVSPRKSVRIQEPRTKWVLFRGMPACNARLQPWKTIMLIWRARLSPLDCRAPFLYTLLR